MIVNVLWIELVMTITVGLLVKMLVVKMLNVRQEIMEPSVLARLGSSVIHLPLVVRLGGLRLMSLDSQDLGDILILISSFSQRTDFLDVNFLSWEILFRVENEKNTRKLILENCLNELFLNF